MKTNHQLGLPAALSGALLLLLCAIGATGLVTFASPAAAADANSTASGEQAAFRALREALQLPREKQHPVLESLAETYPGNPYIAYWLAVRELEAKENASARRLFLAILEQRSPGWVSTWSAVRLFQLAHGEGNSPEAATWRATAFELLKTHGDGGQLIEPFLNEVVRPRPPRAEVEPLLRAALAEPADKVIPALAALREKYPTDVYVTYWLGVKWFDAGDATRAQPLFQEVADQKIENWVTAWATFRLGMIARAQGNAAEADELTQKSIRMAEEYGNGGESISKTARFYAARGNG